MYLIVLMDMTRPRFGLLLDHQFPRSDNLSAHLDSLIELTERARDLGFDAVFGIHHFLASLRTPQPFSLLARLIPHSGDMLLGTSVYVSTLPHPVQLAEEIATLDQLSKGRFIFGAGIGYRDEEFASFGIDRRTRAPRFLESLDVIKGLWSDEPFTYRGKYFQIDGQQSSVRPVHGTVPIWIGANATETIHRAARIGDAWIASPNVKRNFAVGHLNEFRDIRTELGRTRPTDFYPIARELHISDTDDEARNRVSDYLKKEYIEYSQYDLDYFVKMYDELMEKSFFIGSAESVSSKVADYVSGGFNFFLFRTFWSGLPYENAFETIERFARDVMPRFKEN